MVKGGTRFLQQDKNNDKDNDKNNNNNNDKDNEKPNNNNNKNVPETDPPTMFPTKAPITKAPTQMPTMQPVAIATAPPATGTTMLYGDGDYDTTSSIVTIMGKMSISFSIWNLELVDLIQQTQHLEDQILSTPEDAIIASQSLQLRQHHEKLIAIVMESFLCKETNYKLVPLHVYRSTAAATSDGATNNAVTRQIWNHVLQYTDICAKYRKDDTGDVAAYYDDQDEQQQNAFVGGDGIPNSSNSNTGGRRATLLRGRRNLGGEDGSSHSSSRLLAQQQQQERRINQYDRANIQKYDVVSENEAFFSESLHKDTSVVESHPIIDVVVSNSTSANARVVEYTTWTMEYYIWNISQVAFDRVTQHNWNNDPSAGAFNSNNQDEQLSLLKRSALDRLEEHTQLAIDWNIRNGQFDEKLQEIYSNDGSLNWEYQLPAVPTGTTQGEKSSVFALAGIAGEELQAFQSKGVLNATIIGATYTTGHQNIDTDFGGNALFIIGVIMLVLNTAFVVTMFILGHLRLKRKDRQRTEREAMQLALLASATSNTYGNVAEDDGDENMRNWMNRQQQNQAQQHQQFDSVFKKKEPSVTRRSRSLASGSSSDGEGGVQLDTNVQAPDIEHASSYSSSCSGGMYQIPSNYNVRPRSVSASIDSSRNNGRATPPPQHLVRPSSPALQP